MFWKQLYERPALVSDEHLAPALSQRALANLPLETLPLEPRPLNPFLPRDLSDAEFAEWLEAEEGRVPHDQAALDALTSCMAALQDGRHERGRAQLAAMAAHQHLELSNLTAARRLLIQVRGWAWPEPPSGLLASTT
jgi:hypothetical protein